MVTRPADIRAFPCKYDEACYNALNVKKSSNVHIVIKAKK